MYVFFAKMGVVSTYKGKMAGILSSLPFLSYRLLFIYISTKSTKFIVTIHGFLDVL